VTAKLCVLATGLPARGYATYLHMLLETASDHFRHGAALEVTRMAVSDVVARIRTGVTP
jgi:hypothetical protein